MNNFTFRFAFFFLMLVGINFSGFSQKIIVEQDFSRTDVCKASNKEACVTLIAGKFMVLKFESNVDISVNIASRKEIGNNMEYTLHFPADMPEYFNRILTVYCQPFEKSITIPLLLAPKEAEFYHIKVSECYNDYFERGTLLFKQSSYIAAKEEFIKAQDNCPDALQNDDVNKKVKLIDSIITLKSLADRYYDVSDFAKAEGFYEKYSLLNSEDEYAKQRLLECRNKKNNEPQTEPEKDVPAKELEKELPIAITFQWAPMTTFGLSIGGYNNRSVSAYFTLLFNLDLIQGFRENYAKSHSPEFDVAIGVTVRPVRNKYVPLWITVGTGYTDVINYTGSLESPKWNFNHAFSPEVGVLIRIPFGRNPKAGLALRYTFQYRFAIGQTAKQFIDPFNHIVGLGFCF